MSFQLGNSTGKHNGSHPYPAGVPSMTSYNSNNCYGYNSNSNSTGGNGGGGNATYGRGNVGNQQSQMRYQQQSMTPQMHMQQMQPTEGPRMGVLPAGQQPDPNMKVIKLNWGDILGTGGQNGVHGLKVAMVGQGGDMSSSNGVKCTFNGAVPNGMPVHVMNINPYANFMSGQGK